MFLMGTSKKLKCCMQNKNNLVIIVYLYRNIGIGGYTSTSCHWSMVRVKLLLTTVLYIIYVWYCSIQAPIPNAKGVGLKARKRQKLGHILEQVHNDLIDARSKSKPSKHTQQFADIQPKFNYQKYMLVGVAIYGQSLLSFLKFISTTNLHLDLSGNAWVLVISQAPNPS